MDETRYYRFDSGNVVLRRTGDRVEKFGRDGVWTYKPHLISRFANGEEGLEEISEAEAQRLVTAHQRHR